MGSRRRDRSEDSHRYYDWLERASEDIEAAEKLLDSDNTIGACAFHCQQCIEKALKGYILFKTHQHLDGHNLTWLCRQAMKTERHFSQWLDESVILNRYYIETRYPADIPLELDTRAVNRAYDMALAMYRFICDEVYNDMESEED
ncbi:MAG TPA: HEPN domain-containing protein [Ruminiclostridium sp.]|nr:HEPN domain-containing protein [Ruminiclostridium sp.]